MGARRGHGCDHLIRLRVVKTNVRCRLGIDVDKRKIEIEPPIRSLDPHEVVVELHQEITETLKIVVAAK